ncbi:MAG: hypothetical protein IKR86_05925, partial [Candidatus Methanomethylophilaceae archaeon]|nr:hypothetical protein [Candidatus Methanomethylophilaceae archaeon]
MENVIEMIVHQPYNGGRRTPTRRDLESLAFDQAWQLQLNLGVRGVLLKRLRECRDFRALSAYIESVLVLGDETARYLHQLCIAGKYPV